MCSFIIDESECIHVIFRICLIYIPHFVVDVFVYFIFESNKSLHEYLYMPFLYSTRTRVLSKFPFLYCVACIYVSMLHMVE